MSTSMVAGPSRPRQRTSSLKHEIQPPTRRLSAHQVLLLTPFGGVPTAVFDSAPGMARERTSLGSRNRASPQDVPIASSSMGREPSLVPRARSLAAPSPLSQPLTTISTSDEDPSSAAPSREASSHAEEPTIAAVVGTVAMTRSTSLPVLTLGELEAMKDKDTELGIARGGEWAWVCRDEEDDSVEDDITTPGVPETPTPTAFTFSDPFASHRDGTFRRTAETAGFGSYRPIATASVEGYEYAPSPARRASEIPTTRQSFSSNTSSPGSSRTPRRPSVSVRPGLESPRGTHISPHPQRPPITRYKTEPARTAGLGLAIVVKSETPRVGVQVKDDAGGSLGRKGVSLSTVERRERRHAQMRDEREGEFGRRGSWAPVDVVDGLEVAHSPSRNPRGSIISLLTEGRFHSVSEFGASPPRTRTDSLDSVFASVKLGRAASSFDDTKFDTFPRRGSSGLAMISRLRVHRDEEDPGRRGSGDGTSETSWYERRGSWQKEVA